MLRGLAELFGNFFGCSHQARRLPHGVLSTTDERFSRGVWLSDSGPMVYLSASDVHCFFHRRVPSCAGAHPPR
jgi:hypothetical protein